MAAPTSVRVEANSMTTTTIRWSYSGSNGLILYRSTDGSSYSAVASGILSSDTSYTDTELDAGTKYYYKLSDDVGSTFSDVVTVYTHFCSDQEVSKVFSLPRFDGEDPSAKLNELAERVERALGDNVIAPETCVVCPDDGAVIIDCTDGCNSFLIIADTDINSLSINRCGNQDPSVAIFVPPSTTVGICGFPAGYGMSGDECTEAPIAGGSNGRTVYFGSSSGAGGSGGAGGGSSHPGLPKSRAGGSGGSGGGRGGTGCECVPGRNNQLTLKCCSSNCSLGCTTTNKSVVIKVCGGVGPYVFTRTGSVAFRTKPDGTTATTVTTQNSTASPQVTVVPPTNSGSAVSGKAYSKSILGVGCGHSVGTTHAAGATVASYNCDDSLNTCPDGVVSATPLVLAFLDSTCSCGTHNGHAVSGGGAVTSVSCGNIYASGQECAACAAIGTLEDERTAGMISDGCNPCGLQAGSVITVTDASGVSTSVTLRQ